MAEVLAVAGALWTSLFGIFLALGRNYQLFTYDKSMLKRLFFEDTTNGDEGDDSDSGLDGGTSKEKEKFKQRL